MRKKRFFNFRSHGLDIRPLQLKFALLVTIVQSYVSTKFKVYFKKTEGTGQTHRQADERIYGQTDDVQRFMRLTGEDRITMQRDYQSLCCRLRYDKIV